MKLDIMKHILWSIAIGTTTLAACSSDEGPSDTAPASESEAVSFGADDDQCASVVLRNEENDRDVLSQATKCFFSEVDAGTPVTIDIDRPTVEGDSIFFRYAFDGASVLVVEDSRLDAFGTGAATAQRCESVARTDWLPEGVECQPVDHAGFVEAS